MLLIGSLSGPSNKLCFLNVVKDLTVLDVITADPKEITNSLSVIVVCSGGCKHVTWCYVSSAAVQLSPCHNSLAKNCWALSTSSTAKYREVLLSGCLLLSSVIVISQALK